MNVSYSFRSLGAVGLTAGVLFFGGRGGLEGGMARAAGAPQLRVERSAGGVDVAWTAEAVTAHAPFLHYEYQVQVSSNLARWDNFGALVPGGVRPVAAVAERVHLASGSAAAFVRLTYRLNLPGADLSGVNLAGANLSGGDLTGGNLTGADFEGGTIEGTRLDGALLAGVSFRNAMGTPILSVLGGPAGNAASGALPRLRYRPNLADYPGRMAQTAAGLVSPSIVGAALKPATTVGQFNGLLATVAGRIVGCIPGPTNGASGIVTIKLPTTEATIGTALASLRNSGLFSVVARDLMSAPAALPNEQGGPPGDPDWEWGLPAGGGNWGSEILGLPQLWNFTEAIQKRAHGAVTPVTVGVMEGGMVGHDDLVFQSVGADGSSAPAGYLTHGAHVAGIIGAQHGNGIGVQGASPFVSLKLETPAAGAISDQWQIDAVENLATLGAKVVNISIAIPWGTITNAPNNPNAEASLQQIVNDSGDLAASALGTMAAAGPVPILIVAAGNDSDSANLAGADIDARWAGGWANAALRRLVANVFVVESAGAPSYDSVLPGDLTRSPFSNINGHLSAPGSQILSSYEPTTYDYLSGTSMATPQVTGLAAYLLALDPTLSLNDMSILLTDRPVLVSGGAKPMVVGWRAAMTIDELKNNRAVLRMLLDLDDGTLDGNLRVAVERADANRHRAYDVVEIAPLGTGAEVMAEDVDGDGGPGDGAIDMGDFRRWRDWLLADEVTPPYPGPRHGLNGSGGNPKRDANRDGRIMVNEINLYPRGDFNGDGRMDRLSRLEVPGALASEGELKDLEVLTKSRLWQDRQYAVQDLAQLIDSVDFTVFAENFFADQPWAASGEVEIYDVGTRAPLPASGTVTMTRAESVQMFTVPTERAVYVASGPIEIGDGTNVMMRSIGNFDAPLTLRGRDFAVDLAAVEMTAVVEVEELGERVIDSQPAEVEVDAQLEAMNGIESAFEHDYAGARAWANEDGTFYTLARTGSLPEDFRSQGEPTTFNAGVRWQRSFVKEAGAADPTFEVKPMELALMGGGPQGEDLVARAEILVEVRLAGQAEWETNFFQIAEIAGANTVGGPPTYRIVEQEGHLAPKGLELLGVPFVGGATYTQDAYQGEIALDALQPGESFDVRYTLTARAVAYGLDQYAAAWIGDPLDYGSGLRMAYGCYGELPRMESIVTNAPGQRTITFCSKTNFYYLLSRRDGVGGPLHVVAIVLGTDGQGQIVDRSAPAGADGSWYALENQPRHQPLDQDQDGLDDVYEMTHASVLDALEASDALEDPDADGRTNWREYLDGTDPGVANPPLMPSVEYYPGRVFALGGPGAIQAGDVNNDAHMDFVSVSADGTGLQAVLGEGSRSFLPALLTALPPSGYYVDLLLARLNGDAFLDVAVADANQHQLLILLGQGNGRFQLHQTLSVSNFPDRVIGGDFGNDGVVDLVVLSGGTRALTLFAGQGDGSFQARPGIALPFRPNDVVLAHFDGNAQADLAVTLVSSQVAVLSGLGNGAFGAPQLFAAGFEPGRMATAQLNAGGQLDLVVANAFTDEISVLLGNGNNTFQAPISRPVGDGPRGLTVADLNADGRQDVVVSHLGSDYQLVLLGNGSGGFGSSNRVYTDRAEDALLTDLTEDGLLDLVLPVPSGHLMAAGLGAGAFETRSEVVIPRMSPVDFDLVDLNADGRLDAVIANLQSNSVEVLLGQAGGGFGPSTTVIVGAQVTGLVSGLLDAGGTVDLAVVTQQAFFSAGSSSNQLHVLLGNGTGGFVRQVAIGLSDAPGDVLAGDLNADGRMDLVVSLPGTGQTASYLRQADGGYLPGQVLDLGGSSYRHALQDLNGDGRADLVAAPILGGVYGIRVYHAAADGALSQAQEILAADGGSVDSFTLFDLSGDGRPDLILTEGGSGGTRATVALGQPDGKFGPATELGLTGYAGGAIELADIDGDGRRDVISGGIVWLGLAAGGYGAPQAYWIGGSLPVLARDLTGDLRPELITVDDESDSLRVLLHR